jgi:hypothetical protein
VDVALNLKWPMRFWLMVAICDLRFAICDLRFAICDLRFAICDLRFAMRLFACGSMEPAFGQILQKVSVLNVPIQAENRSK